MGQNARTDATSETLPATTGSVGPASPPGYELIDQIGHGGMGVVYRARDTALDRDVAVKLLSERYPPDSASAQRFLSEARITGQLQHPGIPAVHQVGTLSDGRPFLAMKLIKGSTLETILKQSQDRAVAGSPDPATGTTEGLPRRYLRSAEGARSGDRAPAHVADRGRLLAIFEAVCQAVGYAHAHRVIHRDLKPANVMVGAFGEVQVMDWGLAKVLGQETPATVEALAGEPTRAWTEISPTPEAGAHTQAGSLVGTPAFIPPEQAVGEIERVNERSDVFGLGALLAVILTGKPPYVGDTFDSVRVQAVRGKLEDCFARLDASGAEPDLVALCKECLAFEPADRPADGGAVAAAVAGLRAAADERARRAELERVRVEGEQATAAARSAERRKRRRLALGAAAVLAVAAVGGLTTVLAVQRRANAELAAKNAELADEQAKVQARFELAQKAIATFHTGVSEDMLLKNAELKELRTKLLTAAADFYADLEQMLTGETDAKSRKALGTTYFQLGELMDKLGSKQEALAVHGKALALRRELAEASERADVEARLDVARSLEKVGLLVQATGDEVRALAALDEQRVLAEQLEAEHPIDSVRSVLGQSHHSIGMVHYFMGKPKEALSALRQALTIQQRLADANPAVTEFQRDLATTHHRIGVVLWRTGKREEAMESSRKALAIRQKLADANAATTELQFDLAKTHTNVGILLNEMGRPDEALAMHRKASAIEQRLADANPAVTEFQRSLAACNINIANLLRQTRKPAEALKAHQKALAIRKTLAETHPAITDFQQVLAAGHINMANLLRQMEKPTEALTECRKGLAILQQLADANPSVTDFQNDLAWSHRELGGVLARQQRFTEALAAIDAGLAIYQKTASVPGLAFAHASRGWALVRAGQPSKAVADLRQAVELWAKAKIPDFERSRTLALLAGLSKDGKFGVTNDEAKMFADQSVAALADAVNAGWTIHAGWNWPDELKEPDFDALRARADFQKLVAELEARNIPAAATGTK
jgi:serine/threonine protein kinase